MRRRSGQKGDETAIPVESCKNRRVLQERPSPARTVKSCKNRRVLQEPLSSARTVESCKNRRVLQEPSSPAGTVEFCKNRRVLQEPSSPARTVESCKNRRVLSARTVEFCKTRRVLQEPSSSARTVKSVSRFTSRSDGRWRQALSLSGLGIGTIIFPPLIEILVDEYGWRGAALIVAGLVLNGCVFGALLRPLELNKQQQRKPLTDWSERALVKHPAPLYGTQLLSQNSSSLHSPPNTATEALKHDSATGQHLGKEGGSSGNVNADRTRPVAHSHSLTSPHREVAPKDKCFLFRLSHCSEETTRTFRQMIGLFKDVTFLLFAISDLINSLGYHIPFIYLPDMAEQLGISKLNAAFLVSVIGITNITGGVISGWLSDCKCVNRLILRGTAMTFSGIVTSLSIFCFNYEMFVFYAVLYGSSIDDAAIVAHTLEDIKEICEHFEQAATLFGLTISTKKIVTLHQPPLGQTSTSPHIEIYGTPLKLVNNFTYVGSTIASDNTIYMEINNRIRAASGGLWKGVWSQHGIAIATKSKVYKAVVLPTLLYSAETYTLYRRLIRTLSKVHLRHLRQILRISLKDHISNVDVLRQANRRECVIVYCSRECVVIYIRRECVIVYCSRERVVVSCRLECVMLYCRRERTFDIGRTCRSDGIEIEQLTEAYGLLILFEGVAAIVGPPVVGWLYDMTHSYDVPFVITGAVIALSGLYAIPCLQKLRDRRGRRRLEPSGDVN
ncbi:hypothetical protein LSAT2_019614 [Lamellibrachia satsuma]|nr:hypothetical protein LSAT2_019614 [Lamellibrachia satsuma]